MLKELTYFASIGNRHSLHTITFNYKNYRGDISNRTVHPIKMWYGVSNYHLESGNQWMLQAYDPSRGETRDFLLRDMIGAGRNTAEDFDKEDPSKNHAWNMGLQYCMDMLCKFLKVDPETIAWDSATETLEGDVLSTIGKIFADMGEKMEAMRLQLEDYESYDTSRDTLPNGHVILEQAENIDGGTVTQTVQRPNGTEYHRIVDSDEAYSPIGYGREGTMVLDATGKLICVGDIVRLGTEEPFNERHGAWCDYVVEKSPAGYRLAYIRSEKGQVLPKGYTAGFMNEFVMEKEDKSFKEMVFLTVPVQTKRLEIVTNYTRPA
jgi:hypothetical protein